MIYAGFWVRFVAWFIDAIIIGICVSVIHKLLDTSIYTHFQTIHYPSYDYLYSSPEAMLLSIISLGFCWIYTAGFKSSHWQATPGMRLLSLKITDYSNERISFGRATVRYCASWVSASIFMIGYIMIAFTPRKQGLHDYIADTLVVRKIADRFIEKRY